MKTKFIKSKSCMNKSKITDYVINPYIGCVHGCRYCYAVFMKKFMNIIENWGDFCYVKINCSELLEKELADNKPGYIWMSSVTDCYNPLEEKYELTRKILDIISKSPYKKKFTIGILTKSALVKRDFDLLKKLNCELGMSINTLDKEFSRMIEPYASTPDERIEVLKEAEKHGIIVYGFISPVFLGITNLEELFKKLSFCDYVWVELLNTKKSVVDRLLPVIKKNFLDKLEDFNFMINNPRDYFKRVKQDVTNL
ncbi:radical SAM protein, partial [Candidatus Pacearchaeota archaeon]|nr:radical SAM protein [Candidatus Pacearchaeota archaeon]MBD3282853.1 radical SAM protein [Candidatus Pacearchaeota archaeon]